MNAALYIQILEQTLLPFIRRVYPSGHKFMQDNDPKHTSRYVGIETVYLCLNNFPALFLIPRRAGAWMEENGINWWKTPAESPDLNPIENLWHELKEFMRREIKPKTKEELVKGIEQFWTTVDIAKCTKYIQHLRKVVPKVIELKGQATGY